MGLLGRLLVGILVPLAIHLAGSRLAEGNERIARLSMQARHLTDLVGPLSSDSERQQLIAVEVANHLAKVGQLPAELVPTLVRIAKEGSNSTTALNATEAVINAAKASDSARRLVSREFHGVTPRIYFHVPSENLLPRARAIALSLPGAFPEPDIIVPSVTLKPGPVMTELHYFRSAEKDEAAVIQGTLRRLGIVSKLIDRSIDDSVGGIQPRHYQLWFGKALIGQSSTTQGTNRPRRVSVGGLQSGA
jgi:hypothetical protein